MSFEFAFKVSRLFPWPHPMLCAIRPECRQGRGDSGGPRSHRRQLQQKKISTISGSATAHASLMRPAAFQLSVILACSAFIAAKLFLCAIVKPPVYQLQCGRNRPARPSYKRASLFNQYCRQVRWTICEEFALIRPFMPPFSLCRNTRIWQLI
jgi:hypothetical protein